ncbi:flavodoxin family protein [Desulfovermiculus halophilus]|jgi:multimeric flavodoxin WrbA|uniref:flavodoxin family protein n=1 Tax=Desulfovermiculus halophilus TaxID=339722 RepID=UPI0004898BBF|nr:flavodoxin family protein [Desulfovermiculus halophilus]
MKVLGVSGSPIPNSNTDRALLTALESTGLETEFVKLSDCDIEPCRACLGCVDSNECIIGDDGNILAEKAREADGLIIAGFTPYSSIDGRCKAFMERLYPLRHKHGYMQGKPGGAIVTCAIPEDCQHLPKACENGVQAIQAYMMEEGMEFLGGVKIRGNIPCLTCGFGDECATAGLKMIFGPQATVDSVGLTHFEDQTQALQEARELGENIRASLDRKSQS